MPQSVGPTPRGTAQMAVLDGRGSDTSLTFDAITRRRSACAMLAFAYSALIQPWLLLCILPFLLLYPPISWCTPQPLSATWSLLSISTGLLYYLYWTADVDAPFRGGHQRTWMRRLPLWRWVAEYFPMKLIPSAELKAWTKATEDGAVATTLPSSVNYLVGYHPHGPIAIGALIGFATDALDFPKIFPGIKSFLATLNIHFGVPFHRDFVLSGGTVSVAKGSLTYLLDPEVGGATGNLVVVPVGGAREALESRPGKYVIELSRRFGFFKIALTTGCHLMPCLGFGETRMFDQVSNPPGSRLRQFQEWFTTKVTVSPPLLYSKTILPHRFPLNIVLGRPITCTKNANPSEEQVSELRELYRQALLDLFNQYRPLYDPTAQDIEFI
ncbi:unnamed protein product [Schistocephalus solidus]|uniref:Acyltransferase n=1 Tax=Schistocephalus solidus TaxID=70667 RepID=A0A183SNE1_SCHSO|nr:unnamed protein product [Schistocephalus solidus]